MAVARFRSVEEMPPAWRDKDDPENLRMTAQMMALYRLFDPALEEDHPGVERFRSIEEMKARRRDPYRRLPGTTR